MWKPLASRAWSTAASRPIGSARNTQGLPGAAAFGTITAIPFTPQGLSVRAS